MILKITYVLHIQMSNVNSNSTLQPDNAEIEEKIQMIQRQTGLSEIECKEKLLKYNYNEIHVIKEYLGIPEKKNTQIKSVNQEIYKQLRTKLNGAMTDYLDRVEKGEAKKII
jgi:hypothetical protein